MGFSPVLQLYSIYLHILQNIMRKIAYSPSVATITALIVCMRFSADCVAGG